MYYNFEKEYKKDNPNRKFDLFYWIFSSFLFILFSILTFLGINQWILLIIYFVVFIFGIVLYIINEFEKYFDKKDKGIIKKLEKYVSSIDEKNILNLINILKNNNVTTKDELNQYILHYRGKAPNKIKNNFIGNLVTLLIALASLIIVGYNEETKLINFDKISTAIGISIGIIIIVGIITCIFKMFIDGFLMPKDKLYDELEENLTYIYINFDNYFK